MAYVKIIVIAIGARCNLLFLKLFFLKICIAIEMLVLLLVLNHLGF